MLEAKEALKETVWEEGSQVAVGTTEDDADVEVANDVVEIDEELVVFVVLALTTENQGVSFTCQS